MHDITDDAVLLLSSFFLHYLTATNLATEKQHHNFIFHEWSMEHCNLITFTSAPCFLKSIFTPNFDIVPLLINNGVLYVTPLLQTTSFYYQ